VWGVTGSLASLVRHCDQRTKKFYLYAVDANPLACRARDIYPSESVRLFEAGGTGQEKKGTIVSDFIYA